VYFRAAYTAVPDAHGDGVEAISSDAFVLAQVDLHPAGVLASVDAMAARRHHSPRTRAEIIDSLARLLPQAMDALRRLQ
jgi:hypothetical protein